MPNRTLWFTLLGIAGAVACGGPAEDNFSDAPGASGEATTGGSSSGKGGSAAGGASGKGGTGGSSSGGTGDTGGSGGSSSTTGGSGGTGGSNATGGTGGETGGTGGETGGTAGTGGTGGSGNETGGGSGMPATGGTGSETGGAGGTGGMLAGNGGSAGKPTDPNCEELNQAYAEALMEARTCNANSGKEQCTHTVSSSPTCGCPVFVNPDNEFAVAELARLSKAAAKCDFICPDVLCVEPEPANCVAESSGDVCR